MNRIFRIVWNRAISQLVVTSELGRRTSGGSVAKRAPHDARSTVLPLVALAVALSFATPAFADAGYLAMPGGSLLDINNGTGATNAAGQFKDYTVTFTAAATGNNYILFAFRQDPAYWTFGNVGLYAAGDSTTNLFTNPLFTQGGQIPGQNIQAPAGWGVVYQAGTQPYAAGTWHPPGDTAHQSGNNVNTPTAGSWYDGAVGSFDGIYQGVSLIAGNQYTISFTAMSDDAANTAGSADDGVEMGVYAGQCLSLLGPVANCVPDNPDFVKLATPSDAANAGGPSVVTVDPANPETTSGAGSTDIAFDGGTLTVDQTNPTLGQDITISHNGGTIDQDGHDATFTGTISDETNGVPGDLNIVNSGNGGTVTLTGSNTYTGETTIDNGATLALSGNGSIAQSSGVTNDGTLDISQANGNENIASLGGNGTVQLGTNDLTITDGHDTYTGTIAGTGGVNVTGGTQGFTGTSTYTGGTSVSGGATVSIDNGAALGSGTITLNNGTLDTTQTTTLGNTINVIGTGTVDTATGTTLTHSGAVTGSGDFVKDGEGSLAQTGSLTQSGATIVNDGTLVLSSTNTYSGDTVINAGGTLQVSSDVNLGNASSNIALNGGTLHSTGDVDSARNLSLTGNGTIDTDANTSMTTSGTVSGNGALVKNGEGVLEIDGVASHTGGTVVNDGTLVLTGNNTYTGGTTVNGGGTLEVSSDANLGDASNGLALNGGTLHSTGDLDSARNLSLNGSGTIDTDANTSMTTSGTVSGNGSLVKNGEGVLEIDGVASHTGGTVVNDGTLVLTGNNTYTGGTTVNGGGTLEVSSDANLGNASSNIALNGGTLHSTGDVDSARNLSLTGNGTIDTDANTSMTTSGAVSGNGALVKNGEGVLEIDGVASHTGGTVVNDGTLVLTGNNTYTGGTTVNGGGTLEVSSDANLGNASSNIALNGGTLHSTGDVDSARNLSLTGNGTIDTDANTSMTTSGTVSGNGSLVKNGEGTLEIDGVASHTGGTVVNDGTLVLTGNNTYTGGTTVNGGGTLEVSSDANLGGLSSNIALHGGTLHSTGDVDSARNLSLTGNGTIDTDANTSMTTSGTVSGNGSLVKNGEGALEIDGVASHTGGIVVNDGTLVLTGNNTYTGGTTVNGGGTLQVSSDANLGGLSSNIALNGGTLHTTDTINSSRSVVLSGNGHFDVDADTTMATGGAVSGTGTLVKDGEGRLVIGGVASHTGGTVVNDGILVLTNHNTYTGGNTINGGTLQVQNDSNLGAASNGIAFNGGSLHTTGSFTTARNLSLNTSGTIATDVHSTLVATGTVSGAAGLVKNGLGTLDIEGVASHTGGTTVNAGTLILGGNNTYTGGNTINGGTLQVSSDANLGAASNGIAFNGGSLHTTGSFTTARDLSLNTSGAIATDAGTTLTATGNVSGANGLVKNGEGTLDISGVASHDGGTTVNDGTLILRGNNTYKGGTTINGGTLQVSSDANLGDASGNIAINGGNLTVTETMTTERDIVIGSHGAQITTLDGVTLNQRGDISGSGGLVKLGGGTMIVYGNNTFTGGTLIQGGVIRINTGSSLGTGQILLQGGTLQSDESLGTGQEVVISGNSGVNVAAGTTTVLSGNLVAGEGNGCFVKSGKGYLSLTGQSNLASGTCVEDGVLSANGLLASSFVQVDSGAMLRGTGVISGPVNVQGRLAAGNSPGTLTVAGTVTMQAGSSLQVDIDGLGTGNGAGNYSRVLVVGAGNRFTADGTLVPTLRGITGNASNTYTPALGSTYRIVTADGGVEGRFDGIQQPTIGLPANARFLAFYGVNAGHSIDLRVAPVSYATLLGADAKRNSLAVAGSLDGAVQAMDAGTATAAQNELLYAVSSASADRAASVVGSLSGEVHADQAAAARSAGLGMQRDVSDHLATDRSPDMAHNVWANVTRDGNRSIADNQGSGFETGTDRTTGGIDLYAESGTVLGVAATHHDTNVISHGGSGSIRGTSGMVYAQQALGRSFVLDGVAAYGTTDWTTRRADPLGGSQLETRASGKDSMASATLRMPMQTANGSRIEPYVSVVWQKVERDAVNERGSAAALSLDELSEKGTRVLAGVSMGSKAADPLASTLTWHAGVAVGVDTGDLLDPTVHNTLAGQRFDTAAPGVGRGFVQVNANGTMRLGKSTYLYGGLTAEEGKRRSAYGVTAGVRVAF